MENKFKCVGGIFGDVIGQPHEFGKNRIKAKQFTLITDNSHVTDDSIMTIATMDWLLSGDEDPANYYMKWGARFPNAGYGGKFREWLKSPVMGAYGSFGNGSAMRVSPCGWAANTIDEAIDLATRSALVTHNHEEGVNGAVATAVAIFMGIHGSTKEEIVEKVRELVQYPLTKTLDEIRPTYHFDSTCQGSVPESIQCFIEGTDYEDVVRNAVSMGGDSDTMACIAGSIAEAFGYEPSDEVYEKMFNEKLPKVAKDIIEKFNKKFIFKNE